MVSDWSDSLTSPIDRFWQVGVDFKFGVALLGNSNLSLLIVNGLELVDVHVGEWVEGDFEGLFSGGESGVVRIDEVEVFSELEESVGFLFLFSVMFGVLDHPVFEGDEDFSLVLGDQGVGWDGGDEVGRCD